MRSLLASVLALAVAAFALAAFAGSPGARTTPGVLEVCGPAEREIDARALPRTVDPGRCPVGGRRVEDGSVGGTVPSAGKGFHAEVLTTEGAQELEVRRLVDGTIELDHVGKETPDTAGARALDRATKSPGECSDGAFESGAWRVEGAFAYRINWRTTPGYLSRRAAIGAIRQAGGNVANTLNRCRLGDRVPAGIAYKGYTARQALAGGGSCPPGDGVNAVSFGDLPRALAVACTRYRLEEGYGVVTSSDVKIDNTGTLWTTNPNARSCKRRYDLEGIMTHERGHTFGLHHVPEDAHPNLTMGPVINGACQSSERSLGRGDVLGLGSKYR